jgi:hypothetical protein
VGAAYAEPLARWIATVEKSNLLLMKISENVIQIINQRLDANPQPHLTYVGNNELDTGCLEWRLPVSNYTSNSFQDVDKLLHEIRGLLANYPVFAYKGELSWLDMTIVMANSIVIAPVTDQFEVLRLEAIAAANYGLDTEAIVKKLKDLDQKHGIDIIGASYGVVEFLLKKTPEGEDAQELGEWLLDFCPDLYEAPTEFPEGRIALWWD